MPARSPAFLVAGAACAGGAGRVGTRSVLGQGRDQRGALWSRCLCVSLTFIFFSHILLVLQTINLVQLYHHITTPKVPKKGENTDSHRKYLFQEACLFRVRVQWL